MDKVDVRVIFTVDGFTDALYFTEEAWAKLDPKDLEKMKQERVDNFKAALAETPIPPTTEDLVAEQAEIEMQIADLHARKVDISARITNELLMKDELVIAYAEIVGEKIGD